MPPQNQKQSSPQQPRSSSQKQNNNNNNQKSQNNQKRPQQQQPRLTVKVQRDYTHSLAVTIPAKEKKDDSSSSESSLSPNSFTFTALIWQSIIIILYGIFLEYDFDNFGGKSSQGELDRGYPMYQDVHVMIFVGFGFLMTFAAKYSFSAVGLNFFTSALVLQWAILNQPFWETVIGGKVFKKIGLSVPKMLDADFNAASMMISFGAVLGKVTPTQLIWIVLIGCTLNGLNAAIGYKHLQTADIGGSIFIHIFGAYFGLATSWSLGWFNKLASASGVAAAVEQLQANPRPNKSADIFAMIGTIFLWLYWPSFNGALAGGNQQQRAIVNTVISLCGSCITAYAMSKLLRGKSRFNMVDIQNATLAGGVAVGASADLHLLPWGALLIGIVAGALSVVGYVYVTPFVESKLGLHDTCGVNNLHGMPGLMGGIAGACCAARADFATYGDSLYTIWPAMASSNITTAISQGVSLAGEDRSAIRQGGIQIAAILICLLISIFGGLLTGMFVASPLFKQKEQIFDDSAYWDTEEHEHFENHEEMVREGSFRVNSTEFVTNNNEPAHHQGGDDDVFGPHEEIENKH